MPSALEYFEDALTGEGFILFYGGCYSQTTIYVEHGGAHKLTAFIVRGTFTPFAALFFALSSG